MTLQGFAEAPRRRISVRPYEKQDAEAWEGLIAESWNGTFMHRRKFLSYHGGRFQDLSLVLEDERGRIIGVFPAALDPTQQDRSVSHPGLTYGGIVHAGSLRGDMLQEAMQAIVEKYRLAGLRFLRYKVVPSIYHRVPSADDLYALFRLEAVRCRCELSATIDLAYRPGLSKLRRRDLNKARRNCVKIARGPSFLEPFWPVLEENLATKHGRVPVHNLEHIQRLQSLFPKEIECVVGMVKDEVVAGVVLFRTPMVIHTQYIASSTLGREVAAQTAVLKYAIDKSQEWGTRYFDFGISTEGVEDTDDRRLNTGLQRYKTSFGAGGIVYEWYELNL